MAYLNWLIKSFFFSFNFTLALSKNNHTLFLYLIELIFLIIFYSFVNKKGRKSERKKGDRGKEMNKEK